ncbi:unnamed protein product [Oppiella nova]|uniref:Uncharacterized protein n=1 Tax=Oppiella nova TaxID=334625 RepID=A0A7R9MBL5_9ACAR|nr:unnamed protein product [Oppiella nova]CAG2174391.1 unnamed protein product [Oppiella nova]
MDENEYNLIKEYFFAKIISTTPYISDTDSEQTAPTVTQSSNPSVNPSDIMDDNDNEIHRQVVHESYDDNQDIRLYGRQHSLSVETIGSSESGIEPCQYVGQYVGVTIRSARDFSKLEVRLKTYKKYWNNNVPVPIEQLAQAVGVYRWEVGDDPWIGHAKGSPNCKFLRENIDNHYIGRYGRQQSDTNGTIGFSFLMPDTNRAMSPITVRSPVATAMPYLCPTHTGRQY